MLTLDRFQLVYQGGHHNIYCDGKIHLVTKGGTCDPKAYPIIKLHSSCYPCNCEFWKEMAEGK